jgi:hypothetical protein
MRGLVSIGVILVASAVAQTPPPQKEADEYTLYELLSPESAQFHILYEVTATAAGSTLFFNPIRKGSEASGESVSDCLTGQKIPVDVVQGAEAIAAHVPDADAGTQYLRVLLPRPVPGDGGVRLLIEKTYRDPKSYFQEGDHIVFARSLGIRRNAVVLPAAYEVVSCNVPAQILPERDGRLRVSFMNAGPGETALVLKARRLP